MADWKRIMSLNILKDKSEKVLTQEKLYKKAVSNGAFTVSSSGAKKIDFIKLLSTEEGKSRVVEILVDIKSTGS